MSVAPAMPLFLDAYLADTTHLSTEEHGVYLLLLMAMWRRNGSIPDDDKDLARIVGLSLGKWRAAKRRLLPFLYVENGEITQKRLKKEWNYVQEKREKNAQNGAKGGRPASNKSNELDKANGSPDETQTKANPSPSPTLKSSSSAQADDLEAKLRDAAGLQDGISPGLFVIGPILELMNAGADLETDILPTIRARSARMKRPAGSWSYFVQPIREAYEARIAAGQGLSKPKVSAIKRDEDMTPDELRRTWQKRLDLARPRGEWFTWLWGPMPGQEGCRVPPDMIERKDGHEWREHQAA